MTVPDLLLLDEPTAGADEESADTILQTAAALKENGTACVIISHQAEDLKKICDNILWLEKGQIKN